MRIKVKADGKNINVRIPSVLLSSSLVFKIIEKNIEDNSGKRMDKETSKKVHKLLKQAVKKYKGLKLVEVHSADGEIVEIVL